MVLLAAIFSLRQHRRGGVAVTDDFQNWEVLSASPPDNRNMVLFPERIDGDVVRWDVVRTDDPAAYVSGLPAGAQSLVMTHSHDRDYELMAALLKRDDLPAPGLIGSKTKWARFRKQLLEDGISEARVTDVTCPIGLPGIPGKRPQEIAVAVAADLLRRFHAETAAETEDKKATTP